MFCGSYGENRVLWPSFEIEHEESGSRVVNERDVQETRHALNSTQLVLGTSPPHSTCQVKKYKTHY